MKSITNTVGKLQKDIFFRISSFVLVSSLYHALGPSKISPSTYKFKQSKNNRNKLNSNLKIIENDKRFLMFDMLKIIENATEVHSMQTGMKDLINSFKFNKPKFYLHWYVRPYNDNYDSVGLNKFTKIY